MKQEDWNVPEDYIANVFKEWDAKFKPFWDKQPTVNIDSPYLLVPSLASIELSMAESGECLDCMNVITPLTYACGWYPKQLPTPEDMANGIDKILRYICSDPMSKEIQQFLVSEFGDIPMNVEFPKKRIELSGIRMLIVRIQWEFEVWKSFDQIEEKLVLRGRYTSIEGVI